MTFPVLGEAPATERQRTFMTSLSSRYGELLPANFHGARLDAAEGALRQPLSKRQAIAWLDAALQRHPEARPQRRGMVEVTGR